MAFAVPVPASAAPSNLSTRKLAIGAVLGLAVLGLAVAGLKMSGSMRGPSAKHTTTPTLGSKGTGTSPTMVAQGTGTDNGSMALPADEPAPPTLTEKAQPSPTPILATRSSEAPPVLQKAAPAPSTPTMQEQPQATMPDDVRKWLEHLEKIERERQALASRQLSAAMSMFGAVKAQQMQEAMDPDDEKTPDSARSNANKRSSDYANSADGLRAAWSDLLSKFRSVQAPASCVSIQSSYASTLGETGSMILELVNIARNASSNPQAALTALTAMQGTSNSRVDAPAKATDAGVAQVCQRYNTAKWFDIKADFGSGLMSQLGM